MKRLAGIIFIVFWGVGIFFLLRFFTNLRSSYRSSANLAENSVLKILPKISNSGELLDQSQIKQLSGQYSGLIVTADNLTYVKDLARQLRASNPEFRLYLQLSLSKIPNNTSYPYLNNQQNWLLVDDVIDIRDPLYRQAFFQYWQEQLAETKVHGLYLTDVNSCPGNVSLAVCQSQYAWWEMGVLDFMAQIRQYFTDKTVLVEANPIVSNQEELTQKLLQQTDGLLLNDFAAIYNNEEVFGRYYRFLNQLLQEPQNLQKQLVFTVIADPSLQAFFQNSYLLFANEYSSYYFQSANSPVPVYQPEWSEVYEPSLNPAIQRPDRVYQRELGNSIIFVNPGQVAQNIVLDQPILQNKTARVRQGPPVKFEDRLLIEAKSAQVISFLTANEPSSTPLPKRMAEWSDANSSRYSDFTDQYLLRDSSSLLLGNQASQEDSPKNYDDSDDGLLIDGLEAGIFNLNIGQTYYLQLQFANLRTGSGQVEAWVDRDGKNNLEPELVFRADNITQTKIGFDYTVPETESEYLFLRLIAQDGQKGEVEDYLLKVQ